MKIYVYDTEPGIWGIKRFLEYLNGTRYMALSGSPYPMGRIVAFGRSPKKAFQKGIRNSEKPQRLLVLEEEV